MNAAASGAARERTALAWRRTALAFAVNGILLMRGPEAWLQIAALLVVAAAAGIATVSAARFRDPATHGWLAGRRRRAVSIVLLAAAVGVLDLIAITR